jgi:hypothetical protein
MGEHQKIIPGGGVMNNLNIETLQEQTETGRWQRPVRKMVQHIDDTLFHLGNVRGLSKDQSGKIENYLNHVQEMLREAFREVK